MSERGTHDAVAPAAPVAPPGSEEELLQRAEALAGRTLGALAATLGAQAPEHLRGHKGWVGNLLERLLGSTAGSKSAPDFERLGVELKTLPVDRAGKPRESTYVCVVPLADIEEPEWESSSVLHKLRRVLWVPILADKGGAIGARVVGRPLLWSPDESEMELLRSDWQAHTTAIRQGFVEHIRGTDGVVLQIRPKAAHSRVVTWGVGPHGQAILTNPRGYYLRAQFTAGIISRHFRLA